MSNPASHWRPSATIETLQGRALALTAARQFFAEHGVMEVETPILVNHPVSDPQLANLPCRLAVRPEQAFYLHTSPEYHMKRLLAAGAPDIYYLGKAFRDAELGHRHLPEFTLVEWYRRGSAYPDFIRETTQLIGRVGVALGRQMPAPVHHRYASLFRTVTGLDPLAAELHHLRTRAAELLGTRLTPKLTDGLGDDRTAWLDLLMVEIVEPSLRGQGLVVVDGYPAEQAALARLDQTDPRVAQRFEVYLDGIELANGYHELSDAGEQARRFAADRSRRRQLGLTDTPPDTELLAALQHGLPDCCGVALGFDRLLMTCLGLGDIARVVSFAPPEER